MSCVPTLRDLKMTHDPKGRGYHAIYRENQVNYCPGCGRSNWIIGRISAECGFCSTTLELREGYSRGRPAIYERGKGTELRKVQYRPRIVEKGRKWS